MATRPDLVPGLQAAQLILRSVLGQHTRVGDDHGVSVLQATLDLLGARVTQEDADRYYGVDEDTDRVVMVSLCQACGGPACPTCSRPA